MSDLPEDDPRLQLVQLLRRVTVELDLLGARFAAAHELHPTDLRALTHLLDAERAGFEASPGWLAAQLGMNSAGVTAVVDRLERLGHVRRVRDAPDRRRVRVALEQQAYATGWAFFGPLISDLITALRDFDEQELASVHRFLSAVDVTVRAAQVSQE